MHARTFGIVEFQKKNYFVNIFGQRGHGMPGLYFTGAGYDFRVLREKILYLVRVKGLGIPLGRYAITTEVPGALSGGKACNGEHLLDLELPILILFLQLAESIRIHHLERCFSGGRIHVDGTIHPLTLGPRFLREVGRRAKERACYLSLDQVSGDFLAQISLRHIAPRLFCDGGLA